MPGSAATQTRAGAGAEPVAHGAALPPHIVDALRFVVDQDFLMWAALPGTAALVADLLADAKAGRSIDIAAVAARAVAQAAVPAASTSVDASPKQGSGHGGLGGLHGGEASTPPSGGMPPHAHPHGGMASALSPAGPLMPSSPRARFSVAGGPAGGSPSASSVGGPGGAPLFPGGAPPSPTLAGASGPAVWHSHSAAVSMLGGTGGGGHDDSELASLDGGKGSSGVQSPPAGGLAVPLSPKLPLSPSRAVGLVRSPPVSPKFVSSGSSAFGLGPASSDEAYPLPSLAAAAAGSPRSPSARRSYAAVAATGGFGSEGEEVPSGGSTASHSPVGAANIGIALSPPLLTASLTAAAEAATGVVSPLPPQSPRSMGPGGLRGALSPTHAAAAGFRPPSPPASVLAGAGLEAFPLAAARPLSPASDTGSEGILLYAAGDDTPVASADVSPNSDGKTADSEGEDEDRVSLATASDGEAGGPAASAAARRAALTKATSSASTASQGPFDAAALSLDLEQVPSDTEGKAASSGHKTTKRALEAELAAVEDKTASDSKETGAEEEPTAAATAARTNPAGGEVAPAPAATAAAGGSSRIPPFFTKRAEGQMRTRGKTLPGDALNERLPAIVELFKRHGLYAATAEAVSGGVAGGAANAAPAKAAPPCPPVAVFPTAQAAAAGKTTASSKTLVGPGAMKELEAVVTAAGGHLSPCRTTIAIEGVEVSWEDAHLALPVEQFAAVAKTLCGFPSFFAAPLFRRVRQQFLGDRNNHGLPRAPEHNLGAGVAVEVDATGAASGPNAKPRHRTLNLALQENAVTPGEAQQRDTNGLIPLTAFLTFWRREIEPYDHVDRFFRLVRRRDREAIEPADFMPLMEELLAFHPGLAFLEATPEFQEKYARTVIARIFYNWDPLARRALDARALRRSDLLQAFHTVDVEEDINLVTAYFSYEHFYVLYCKFWELDTDRDFLLSRADLNRLSDLTRVVLDRVFTQSGRPFTSGHADKMGYEDFVVFYMSEQDKTTEAALRYWFGVCDVDGDGYLSPQDLKFFYQEQEQRMRDWGMDVVGFPDVLCQMTDLLKPKIEGRIQLADFLHPDRCKLTGVLYSALFNLAKFQAFESRDPQYVKQEVNINGPSQWDKFAQIEYSRLASEEEMQAD